LDVEYRIPLAGNTPLDAKAIAPASASDVVNELHVNYNDCLALSKEARGQLYFFVKDRKVSMMFFCVESVYRIVRPLRRSSTDSPDMNIAFSARDLGVS